MKPRIAVYGATSAIAQAAIRLWAAQGARLVLLARHTQNLNAIAADARVRGATVKTLPFDTAPQKVWQTCKGLDGLLLAHGSLGSIKGLTPPLPQLAETLATNGTSPVHLLTQFAPLFAKQNAGWMAAITSVAAVRGRTGMYAYGAAKAMVAHYLQGLRHALAQQGSHVRIIDLRPGPIDTPMTRGLKAPLMSSPAAIAPRLVQACASANGTVYLPGVWRYIMAILSHLPETLWLKLKI
ncbi:MAG TPA: SDR family NAD(P)-dependent oxidoreductase [Alphaproteobacteria bacterium]|nr:SDR family NAD(P)-dependent oxidoreductase [Alphaproteobacteria bacterium]